MFRNIHEQIEYAGFILYECGDDMFIIREQTDNAYDVYLGDTLLGSYTTIDEAVDMAQTGIAKMAKLNESNRPVLPASKWVQTEEGVDFVAELLYRSDDGYIRKYDIGIALKDFGILATSQYIEYFVGLLNGQGIEVR
jgi:hypothetical protein